MPSPISDFAERATEYALALVRGEPAPAPPIATDSTPDGTPSVVWADVIEARPRELTVIGFAIDVEVTLKEGTPPPSATGPARWGSLRLTLAISRAGLRLVAVRPRPMRSDPDARTLPSELAGMGEVVGELLDDLRAGDVTGWVMRDGERALLDNETVWARVMRDRPGGPQLHAVRDWLQTVDAPLGYELGDAAILVRDEHRRLFSLSLGFVDRGTTFGLSSDPALLVGQLWPLAPGSTLLEGRR